VIRIYCFIHAAMYMNNRRNRRKNP